MLLKRALLRRPPSSASSQKPAAIFHPGIVSEHPGQTNSRPSISSANISISGIHLTERNAPLVAGDERSVGALRKSRSSREAPASPAARRQLLPRNSPQTQDWSASVGIITVRDRGSLLRGGGEAERPGGGMRRLGGGPQFLEGQGLAVISERVLLQLADGHRGEGTGQAFVRVLLT